MNHIELGSFWLPRQSSTIAAEYDRSWAIVSMASAVLFAIVVGAMIWFVIRYRRRTEHDKVETLTHSFRLEVFWTLLPTILVMWLFFVGFKGFVNASVSPGDAFEIHGVGQKWSWAFTYPNGNTLVNELRVPVGRPVKVVLSAKDVLHSFFIPEFRVKRDAVPGAYNTVWFEANHAGETILECAEYCGLDHSNMLARVIMMEDKDFDGWLEKAGDEGKDMAPVAYGQVLYGKSACESCHSLDGSVKIGPSWKGIWGRKEHLADGSDVTVDENYLRESILNPTAKVVAGYQPVMPPYQGVLNDRQIDALIAFMKAQK